MTNTPRQASWRPEHFLDYILPRGGGGASRKAEITATCRQADMLRARPDRAVFSGPTLTRSLEGERKLTRPRLRKPALRQDGCGIAPAAKKEEKGGPHHGAAILLTLFRVSPKREAVALHVCSRMYRPRPRPRPRPHPRYGNCVREVHHGGRACPAHVAAISTVLCAGAARCRALDP